MKIFNFLSTLFKNKNFILRESPILEKFKNIIIIFKKHFRGNYESYGKLMDSFPLNHFLGIPLGNIFQTKKKLLNFLQCLESYAHLKKVSH